MERSRGSGIAETTISIESAQLFLAMIHAPFISSTVCFFGRVNQPWIRGDARFSFLRHWVTVSWPTECERRLMRITHRAKLARCQWTVDWWYLIVNDATFLAYYLSHSFFLSSVKSWIAIFAFFRQMCDKDDDKFYPSPWFRQKNLKILFEKLTTFVHRRANYALFIYIYLLFFLSPDQSSRMYVNSTRAIPPLLCVAFW